MGYVTRVLVVVSVLIVGLHAKDLPDAKVIVERMVIAYGGEESLGKLNAYEQFWQVQTKVTDTNATDSRMVVMPNSLTTELIYPDKREIRILHNNYGVKKFGDRTMRATGAMLDAMKLQLMRLYNPLVLRDKLRSIEASQSDDSYVLKLKQGSITSNYFVSKDNYLVYKVVGELKVADAGMEFTTLYDDYRVLDGLFIAHKETKFAGDTNTAVLYLKKMNFLNMPRL